MNTFLERGVKCPDGKEKKKQIKTASFPGGKKDGQKTALKLDFYLCSTI
jgi:hypothetical protein